MRDDSRYINSRGTHGSSVVRADAHVKWWCVVPLMLVTLCVLIGCVVQKSASLVTQAQQTVADTHYQPGTLFGGIVDIDFHHSTAPPLSSTTSSKLGKAITRLGDWDGDGPIGQVVAVGDSNDRLDNNSDNFGRGAVTILFFDTHGAILSHHRINAETSGAPAALNKDFTFFGWSVASLGDLDGEEESVATIAVGAPGYKEDGRVLGRDGSGGGAVLLLYLLPDGSVKRWVVIDSNTQNGPGYLTDYQWYGGELTTLGDWDGDGGAAQMLVVGAPFDSAPPPAFHNSLDPSIFFHSLYRDGSIQYTKHIDNETRRMPADKPEYYSEFGHGLAFIPGDSHEEGLLIVGAENGGKHIVPQDGELYLFNLHKDLSIDTVNIINAGSPNAPPALRRGFDSYWGRDITSLQPLLHRNTRGIEYLFGASSLSPDGYIYHVIGLHADLSIATYDITDNSLHANFVSGYGGVFYSSDMEYVGVLNPAMPHRHTIASGGYGNDVFGGGIFMHHIDVPPPPE